MSSSSPAMSSRNPQPGAGRSGGYAASAAHYVIHSQSFSDKKRGIDGYGAYITPKDISKSEHDLASAGAAASLAHQHHAGEPDTRRQGRETPATEALERGDSHVSSKAAFVAMGDRSSAVGEPGEREASGQLDQDEYLEDDPNARLAATSAISGRCRRAESATSARDDTPDLAPAMSAATTSHRTSRVTDRGVEAAEEQQLQHPSLDSARIHNIAVARTQRYLNATRPSGATEADKPAEEPRHAAVISMAQQMYPTASRARETTAAEVTRTSSGLGARRPTFRQSVQEPVTPAPTRQPVDLHAVAEKRVAEQLGRLDSERGPDQRGSWAYQDGRASPRPRSFTSSRVRRWSTSESDAAANVRRRAERKPFQPRPTELEEETSPADQALLAVAQKNVDTTVGSIDKQIYETSGVPTPAKLEEWERIAHERSGEAGVRRTTTTFVPGRGEKLEDQRDVEDVARNRIKPTLKEIDDKVNERKGRDVTKKLDADHEKAYLTRQKQRDLEAARLAKQVRKTVRKENKNKAGSKETNEKAARKAEKKAGKKKAKKKGKGKQAQEKAPTATEEGPQQGETATGGTAAGAAAGGIASASHVGEGEREEKRSNLIQREPRGEIQTAPDGVAMAEQVEGEPASSIREERRQQAASSHGGPNETLSERGTGTGIETPAETTASGTAAVGKAADGPAQYFQSSSALGEGSLPTTSNVGTGDNDEDQLDEYRVRQWSTSTTGGADARTTTTTTTTATRKQRHFLKSIFSRSPARPFSGNQGSFDVQRRAPVRSATEPGGSSALQVDSPPLQSPRGQPPGVSRFQEDL